MYELINELISHREKANVVPKASVRGNKTSFRQSLRNLAAIENAKVPAERRVSQQAVFLVAERSLAKTADLEKKTRQFVAYKEVSSFISLACTGELSTDSQVGYMDLLPVGHPLSSRNNSMTASALRHARSRWIAADPRVDDEAREVVAAAYFYDRSSAEYSHAIASLQVLVAGGVPREIYLSALTAAFSFGSGNSSAARSARANLQWRDRLGRWIEMGRGIGFKINIDGNNVPINGKFIGVDGKRGLVQVKGDPNLPDGIYPVESSNAQEYKALLPDSVAGKLKGKLSSIFDSRAQIFSKEDMIKMRMDAPAGWKKNEDGSFGSDDDYIVDEADGKLTLFRKDKNGDKGAQVGEPVDDWAQIQDLANADEEDYDKFKRIMSAPSNADVLPGSEKDPYDNLNPSAKAVLEEQAAKKAADKAFFAEKKKKYNEDVDKFEAMFEQGKDIEGRDIPEGWELGISKYSTDGVLDIRTFQKLVPSADGENQVQVIAEIDAEGKINFGHRANWFNKNENGTGGYDTWDEVESRIPDVVNWVGDAKSLQHNPADPWFKETIPVPRAGDDEVIAKLPEVPSAPATEPDTSVISKLTPPEGAWKLQSPESFEPEGRVDDEMSPDFSDDPEVIANKFGTDALVDGFIQGIVGKKDYALDLLEDDGDDEEVDDNGDPIEKKPGKPGPKKKKPVAKPVGLGVGALDFNSGEEWVPVEAIYLALKKQGYDADLLLAQLYDTGLGESKNQDLLKSLRKEENVQAETPLLDAIDPDDAEAISRANVDVALADSGSALVSQLMELNRNGEPNPKIVELADAIRKAQGAPVNDNDSVISEDLEKLLDDYIGGALNPDATPEEKQAFQALWATITALDEGISDGVEKTRLANGVYAAIKKYNGSAEWPEVKEFFDKNGNINDLIKSKQALIDGRESIDSDTSFAGAFFRLMTESSRYNQVSLHRGLQVPNDSPLIEKIKNGDVLAFDARSFSTSDINASIFAGALSKSTDKTSIVFTVKPNKGRSVDLTTISTFNEQEHRMLGNFKIVEVDETTTSTGRKVLKVEIEMLSKRDAVLEGLDTSYSELLIKDNASPEMPEGYHKIDPLPYESRAEQDFPEDFEDKPDVVARSYDRDVLAESFRQAIENGSGEVILEWDDEKEVTVAVELIRDALQIQGVDTNALLDDIANADPDAQASDEEAESAEQSVDNPVNAIVEDVSQEYDMEGWKKVGPQLGSNEGGFYEDAEGNRFYVKKPKSDLHAENEVLAAALYKLLGVDAAEIGIGSGDDGVKMTFSPDIIDSKQDLQQQLNNPEYLAKLQEGFAVDAWLGNWDVAGLGFDNVMSDGSGNPVRVDPGGALLFRAMGKPKGSLFGNEVNELDTLRDPSMNPQSAAVFGSMTDEQQKESARKLLAISNDDIDTMVDGIVIDPEAGQEIKDKLKARRQFILERYDLLSEDTSILVDNADISEEQDTDPEAVQTPEGKKAEIDSALDTAGGWAQEYADDEKQLAVYRKAFQAVSDQIDTALVDWRNGEISDEELPGVLEELRGMLDTYDWDEEDIGLMNNVDDIDEQLRVLKDYIEEDNNKNAPAASEPTAPVEAPEPVATESVTNPYKDKNGTPIEPGAKIRYEKKGEVLEGVLSRYDKNSGYVWVKMSDGGKPKVFSTKYLTVIDGDGGGGEGPKAPEAPDAPEPEAPEAPTPETPQDDIGQFEPTAQLTEDGKKVRVSFVHDGTRPFNPNGNGPSGYEEVLPYVVDSKLDVDGVDEITVEVPLDKMDDFAKEYKSVLDEELVPEEFYGDIYTDNKKIQAHSKMILDLLDAQGTKISKEKADQIRDAIDEEGLVDWSEADDSDILSAITDIVAPGIVDISDEIAAGEKAKPEATKSSPSTPFPTEPILNEAANELVKLFSYGMPDGGKILAVHEKDGMIAATPDGETVYIIDAKKKTNYTPEAKPDFFEPGGNGVEVFQWRQPTKEENDALLEKIAQNKSEPFGTESEALEDVDAVDEIEVPDGFTAIADSTGSQIFAGVKVADKDGVVGTVLKVNKDNYAQVDFGNGVVKWRSGKTLKSTKTLDENFKGPTAKKSTTKATGAGAEPVIVDSPADWSLSNFEKVPALPDAVAKALDTSDKKAAMRGASAAVDADSIEDLDVRVMHVRNPEGVDGIQLKFKLTNWAGKKKVAEIASMTEQERVDAGIEVSKLRIPRITVGKDGIGDLSPSETAYESPTGRTYKITTKDGIVIYIHRANPDASDTFSKGYGGAPARAFHNTVQIQAPANATDDQIANALALAGVSQVRPATPADAKVLIENRLMSIFDAKTDANTNPKGEARTESLQKVKDKWGLTVDDVVVTTGPSGRIEYRLSEEGALKIWEATGKPEAMSHGLRNPGVLEYSMTDEQKIKAMTDWLVGFVDNPQGGLLSTTTRWTEGIGVNGQSSAADIGTGGADYVFTRPVKSADRKRYGTTDWVPTLYFDPKKVYQRLDFYANYTDAFGKRSKNKDVISAAQVGAYEVMFKQRLSWDDLDVMVVSKDIHLGVIAALKAKGINYIGGRPVEEVIITGTGASKS
jgi:ribosomal protein L35AE/L33A